jgi:hypothetical protein
VTLTPDVVSPLKIDTLDVCPYASPGVTVMLLSKSCQTKTVFTPVCALLKVKSPLLATSRMSLCRVIAVPLSNPENAHSRLAVGATPTAAAALITPAPSCVLGQVNPDGQPAVDRRTDWMVAGLAIPRDSIRAAIPAAWGVAMDVPVNPA